MTKVATATRLDNTSGFLLLSCEVGSAVLAYLTLTRAAKFGAAWLLAIIVLWVLLYAVVNRPKRVPLAFAALAAFALFIFRVFSGFLAARQTTLPTLVCLWAVAGLFVLAGSGMIVTALRIGFRPPDIDSSSEEAKRQSAALYRAWRACVLRPLGLLAIPFSTTLGVWGLAWGHRIQTWNGIDLATATVLATLPSVALLLAWSCSLTENLRQTNGLGKRQVAPDASVAVALAVTYLWGLSVERQVSKAYLPWTCLVILLAFVATLFRSGSSIRAAGGSIAEAIERTWALEGPRLGIFVLECLLLMLLILSYAGLLLYVMP